jgi:hypothetical protein
MNEVTTLRLPAAQDERNRDSSAVQDLWFMPLCAITSHVAFYETPIRFEVYAGRRRRRNCSRTPRWWTTRDPETSSG